MTPESSVPLSDTTSSSQSSTVTGLFSEAESAQYRADFPILSRSSASGAPLAFLDNAGSSQRPTAVTNAMTALFESSYANVHRGIHTLSEEATHRYEQARRTVARFINAAANREVIFTSGTTAAINLVARSWGDRNVSADDVVLLTIAEHHANIVPWHQLAERTGCRVEFIPLADDFTIDDQTVQEHLDRLRPKMFAVTAASNVLGVEFPIDRWTAMAHQAGCTVLVDAAQAAPHKQMDVQGWDSDFAVFSGHKMCGPTGIGVLHGKQSILESIPPFMGGGGMIQSVTTEGFEPAALPEKFEAGTPPIAEAIGLEAAIQYLEAIGLDRIEAHERALCHRADAGLRALDGVRIIGPTPDRKGGIVSFQVDGVHAHDVAQQLDQLGIAARAGHHCTMPLHHALGVTATTRASFYLYNTLDEADRLVEAVKEVQTRFAPSGRRRKRRG